jgi:hypothetical protein
LVQAAQLAEAIVVWDHSNQYRWKALERLAIAAVEALERLAILAVEALESLDTVGEDGAAGSRTVYSWWMRLDLGGAHRVTILILAY